MGLKPWRTIAGSAKAAEPSRCRRCLVTPVKSHSMTVCSFTNVRKCFCKDAGVPDRVSDGPTPVPRCCEIPLL